MIISVSRRTDIPAFYTDWLMNRIRAGYCTVPNPFNLNQVSYVSLKPQDVDALVFWTRNPRPLFPHLAELDALGYRYYFQYTLMDNPKPIDLNSPAVDYSIRTLQELAQSVGREKTIWRYDPIVLSNQTDVAFHEKVFQRLATELAGATNHCVISLMDPYPKASRRLRELEASGFKLLRGNDLAQAIDQIIPALVRLARQNGMEITSCAETYDLSSYGVLPGKCVDDDYIQKVFGWPVTHKKDPSQRKECGCVISKDIGSYDTCLFGCSYCYATRSFDLAKRQHAEHNPNSPSLTGWYEAEPTKEPPSDSAKPSQPQQLSFEDLNHD